ncbi:hypothetical protein HDV00_006647 [Rhizophlyctis rosea]|nr:hypothetical protein HDV00_006647 [Rhizophlyctis rosea]
MKRKARARMTSAKKLFTESDTESVESTPRATSHFAQPAATRPAYPSSQAFLTSDTPFSPVPVAQVPPNRVCHTCGSILPTAHVQPKAWNAESEGLKAALWAAGRELLELKSAVAMGFSPPLHDERQHVQTLVNSPFISRQPPQASTTNPFEPGFQPQTHNHNHQHNMPAVGSAAYTTQNASTGTFGRRTSTTHVPMPPPLPPFAADTEALYAVIWAAGEQVRTLQLELERLGRAAGQVVGDDGREEAGAEREESIGDVDEMVEDVDQAPVGVDMVGPLRTRGEKDNRSSHTSHRSSWAEVCRQVLVQSIESLPRPTKAASAGDEDDDDDEDEGVEIREFGDDSIGAAHLEQNNDENEDTSPILGETALLATTAPTIADPEISDDATIISTVSNIRPVSLPITTVRQSLPSSVSTTHLPLHIPMARNSPASASSLKVHVGGRLGRGRSLSAGLLRDVEVVDDEKTVDTLRRVKVEDGEKGDLGVVDEIAKGKGKEKIGRGRSKSFGGGWDAGQREGGSRRSFPVWSTEVLDVLDFASREEENEMGQRTSDVVRAQNAAKSIAVPQMATTAIPIIERPTPPTRTFSLRHNLPVIPPGGEESQPRESASSREAVGEKIKKTFTPPFGRFRSASHSTYRSRSDSDRTLRSVSTVPSTVASSTGVAGSPMSTRVGGNAGVSHLHPSHHHLRNLRISSSGDSVSSLGSQLGMRDGRYGPALPFDFAPPPRWEDVDGREGSGVGGGAGLVGGVGERLGSFGKRAGADVVGVFRGVFGVVKGKGKGKGGRKEEMRGSVGDGDEVGVRRLSEQGPRIAIDTVRGDEEEEGVMQGGGEERRMGGWGMGSAVPNIVGRMRNMRSMPNMMKRGMRSGTGQIDEEDEEDDEDIVENRAAGRSWLEEGRLSLGRGSLNSFSGWRDRVGFGKAHSDVGSTAPTDMPVPGGQQSTNPASSAAGSQVSWGGSAQLRSSPSNSALGSNTGTAERRSRRRAGSVFAFGNRDANKDSSESGSGSTGRGRSSSFGSFATIKGPFKKGGPIGQSSADFVRESKGSEWSGFSTLRKFRRGGGN